MELTDQKYWEEYYKKSGANREKIISVVSKYDSIWNFVFKDLDAKKLNLIEIVGYPGRYLAYLSDKYGIHTTSLDFNSDRKTIDEAMATFGIKEYEVIQADLLKHEPVTKYDIVYSNGFIEHFDDYETILSKHLNYLKPGGKLVVIIPNKRFYKWFYQKMFDQENLAAHNLSPMRLSIFKDFAKKNGLKIGLLTYFAGFQYATHKKQSGMGKVIVNWHERIFKKLLNPIIVKYPNRLFSNLIVAVFESPK